MRHLHPFWIRLLAVIGMLLPLPACALSGNTVEGQVLEEGTNKPLAGAIVVALWKGHLASFAHGKTVCYHVLTTTTDAQGRYKFPAWKKDITEDWQKNIQPEDTLITAHHPGYRWSERLDQTGRVEYLKPFTGTKGERLEYLLRVSGATGCGTQDESKKNLLPLGKALYEEAKNIAVTKEDKQIVSNLLQSVEWLELGSDKSWENWEKRKREPQ